MPKQIQPPPIRVDIHPDDSLPTILNQVRLHKGKSVVLEIPQHCPLLLTATEFRTLRETATRHDVTIAIHSEDRLRDQLSVMFGIKNVGKQPTDKTPSETWRPPETTLATRRGWKTWDRVHEDDDDEDDAPRTGRSNARRSRDHTEPSLDYIQDEHQGGLSARRLGQLAAVVTVLALLAALAGWYAMPGVTVNATLQQETVTSEVLYSVAAEGASLPGDIAFTADAEEASATVPFTITVETTGVERTPDQTARGSVLFRNPTDAPVTVPAGTELTLTGGVAYTTDENAEVPAASGESAGEASVNVTAAEAGSRGNAEAGMLTGQLPDLGVFYSNREKPIDGGTDIEVHIASEEDITNLEDRVRNDLQRSAANGWNEQLGEGQAVVPPSVQTGEPTYEMNVQAGDEAEEITVTGTVDATGLVYNRANVEQQTREFVQTALQELVPEGYALDADSLSLGEPTVLSEAPDNVQYSVEATATATAVFDDAERAALANDLAGLSWDAATARINEVPEFQSAELETNPGWWFERMPQAENRVKVEVNRPAPVNSDASPKPSPESGS